MISCRLRLIRLKFLKAVLRTITSLERTFLRCGCPCITRPWTIAIWSISAFWKMAQNPYSCSLLSTVTSKEAPLFSASSPRETINRTYRQLEGRANTCLWTVSSYIQLDLSCLSILSTPNLTPTPRGLLLGQAFLSILDRSKQKNTFGGHFKSNPTDRYSRHGDARS